MPMTRRRRFVASLLAACALATLALIGAAPASAQTWPTAKPIMMVAPFPPGPALDLVARLAVNAALPVNSMAELIDYARARPGPLSYGSSGTGSVFHLMGELF